MKETITWMCEACNLTLEHEAFVEHAKKVHGLAQDATGQCFMLQHSDAQEWFSTAYQWMFDTFSAVQVIKTPRTGEDLALWMGD